MPYVYWLVSISVFFALAERARPRRRPAGPLRPQIGNDLFYLVFNGHFYAVLFGGLAALAASYADSGLERTGWSVGEPWLNAQPFAVQFLLFLVVSDFLQWCVHNLLHRVPALWQFHKVHHSIHTMDWAGNFRFHWVEIVVYRSLLYVPLVMLGGSPSAVFAVAVFATFWGHFNHSNLALSIGPLGWLFNSPAMHLWHHDASSEGGTSKNFGIVFSIWDHLFGTAYWPRERAPREIGYQGDEELPEHVPGQLLFPLWKRR